MPRPTSKDDLLVAIDQERGALEALLEILSPDQNQMTQSRGQSRHPPRSEATAGRREGTPQ